MDSEPEFKSSHLDRISFLAQPKKSKTVWATTPWILTWGNQESIRPLSRSAMQAVPSPRIKALAQPKKDFCLQIQLRKEEEEERRMKISRPSSHAVQYENVVRLATPKTRGRSAQEVNSPHSLLCEHDCPIWHVSPSVRNVVISPRILRLANPKTNHPIFTSNRQTFISYAAQTAKMTSRLEQLSLPKLRKNRHFYDPGRPESPIRTVRDTVLNLRCLEEQESPRRVPESKLYPLLKPSLKITSHPENQHGSPEKTRQTTKLWFPAYSSSAVIVFCHFLTTFLFLSGTC
ncbi:testicular haploid expressed gene protein-like isoform X2 [Onychostoma macrolepis]|uniref:testicular haploid expressed gene protein-like isoform X2 n=1 Tax=Onychostoma macrolepis TaxID=369639 RepID=UPI00272BE1B2|nr:testicular haploid expressed gene protein-like isoform X2 [Onychostoma macrolepis]